MTIFKKYEITLELVEAIAELENHAYFDEESTSEMFDQYLLDTKFFSIYSTDDEIAINETFSNWMDNLLSDGYLHSEQVNNYCYVGEWS